MKLNIAVLAGDGIGPEIMKQGIAVMQAIAEKFNHEFTYNEAICGAHAIDEVGDPFPEETFKTCMDADAVLFAAVGDPRFDNNLMYSKTRLRNHLPYLMLISAPSILSLSEYLKYRRVFFTCQSFPSP